MYAVNMNEHHCGTENID